MTTRQLGAAMLAAVVAMPLLGGPAGGATPPPTLTGLMTTQDWGGTMEPLDVCHRAGTSEHSYSENLWAQGTYSGTGTQETALTFGPQTGPNTSFGGDLFPTGAILTFDRTFSFITVDGTVVSGTVFNPQPSSRAACGPGTNYPILDGTYFQYTASYTASIATPDGMYSDSGTVTGVVRRIIYDGQWVSMHGGQNTFTSALTTTTPVPDTVPPLVTGQPDRSPNAAGWYNAPVTINWSSVDPAPSSGTPSDPPDSMAQTEAQSLSYTSAPSCDPAGNCATGSLTLSIDRTAPVVGSAAIAPTAVGIGGTATMSLPASDGLSGLAGGEAFVGADPGAGHGWAGTITQGQVRVVIGPGLGPGNHTIFVRAMDAAGNWSATRSAVLRVTGVQATERVFTVNVTDDVLDKQGCTAAHCSLREAITAANKTQGLDRVHFSIAGDTTHTIQPRTTLPAITDPVVIDGTTEPSFALHQRPVVELDGSLAPATAVGLRVTAGSSTIRGLAINRFGTSGSPIGGGSGIVLESKGGNRVEGNYIGTDATGHLPRGNRLAGISVQRSSDNIIGGTAAGTRNVVSANGTGIGIAGNNGIAARNRVIGNYIGVDAEGDNKLGNQIGVGLSQAASNTIGGAAAGEANVISANAGAGVEIRGTGSQRNVVAGNLIGTDAAGTANFGNFRGVFFTSGAFDNTVGGTATGAGNLIAFNSETGVLVPDIGVGGRSVQIDILGNSIHSNGIPGLTGLGIDLTPQAGVTPNDSADADLGGNRLMNFPILTSAVATTAGTTVEGSLNSEASRTFRVEFFAGPTCDANGHGEGRDFIGATSVGTSATGLANVHFTAADSLTPGWFVTATSTEAAFGNTSEFSACVLVTAPSTFVQADGTRLSLDGEPWYLYGASIYHASVPGGSGNLSQVLDWAEQAGLNTIRLVNQLDERGVDPNAPYSEAGWQRVDQMLASLAARDMHAILDLSIFRNHLVNKAILDAGLVENCKPGADRTPVSYAALSPYRADLDDEWDAWMSFVANRVNTVTGVRYRDDPTIAIVSIAGEPGPPNSEECGQAASTQELTDFYARAMSEWQTLDPNHLVSNGGFIHLDWEELHGNPFGSGIDWKAIFSLPSNDVPSIHTYTNYPLPMSNPPVPFTEYQTAKIAPFVAALNKPWITEEFGFPQREGDHDDSGRAAYFQQVYDLQAEYGSAGAAFWNLGHEIGIGTFDVSPNTPAVWDTVQQNAP